MCAGFETGVGASVGEWERRVHAQEAVREQPRFWGKFAERERGLRALEAVRERPRADLGELTGEGARSACLEAVCKRLHAIWG
jgi:hypothetical protein